MKDFDIPSRYGIFAATGTPPAIINRMSMEFVNALAGRPIAARVGGLGAGPAGLHPYSLHPTRFAH